MAYPLAGVHLSKIITGYVSPASEIVDEFNNVLNGMKAENINDASNTLAIMQATKDPYPAGVEALPVTLEEELQEIRFQLKQIIGGAQWYSDNVFALTTSAPGSAQVLGDAASESTVTTLSRSGHKHALAGFPSRCKATRTTTQSISSSVWAKAQCNTEVYDNNTEYDPTTNYRWTSGFTGGVRATFSARWAAGTDNAILEADLYFNGVSGEARQADALAGGNATKLNTSMEFAVVPGDYIEPYVWQNAADPTNLVYATFTVSRIW